ncbi:MAG: hypothetical protein P1P84_10030 [Deferrisomatales bacterium]|nr:hypothetical protein [Deferrisomatales bacterium]
MGLIRLLILGTLVWLLVRLVKGLLGPAQGRTPRRPASGGELRGGELVQDPQCGVYIPKETALKGPGGQLFCSPECRDAYRNQGG